MEYVLRNVNLWAVYAIEKWIALTAYLVFSSPEFRFFYFWGKSAFNVREKSTLETKVDLKGHM